MRKGKYERFRGSDYSDCSFPMPAGKHWHPGLKPNGKPSVSVKPAESIHGSDCTSLYAKSGEPGTIHANRGETKHSLMGESLFWH